MRHDGVLDSDYQQQLERMTLLEIAEDAAKFRSDGRRCGTATALILKWAAEHRVAADNPGALAWFNQQYERFLTVERAARERHESERPAKRPAYGGRPNPKQLHLSFTMV